MSAHIPAGRRTARLHVYAPSGVHATLSTGCRTPEDTAEAQTIVDGWMGRNGRRLEWPELCELLATKRLSLRAALQAHHDGALKTLVESFRAVPERPPEIDLAPIVAEWAAQANAKYVTQVRRLIPAGQPFPASRWRLSVFTEFFARQQPARTMRKAVVTTETKRRYKAAFRDLERFLLARELIPYGVVRDVSFPRSKRKGVPPHHTPAQARAAVEAMEEPYRAMAALAAASGLEYGALANLQRRDVDLTHRTVYARGTKTEYRDRYVEVTEAWAWTIVAAYARRHTEAALLFPIPEWRLLDKWQQGCRAAKVPTITFHQLRHSFALMWIDRGVLAGTAPGGRDEAWLKNQLGHGERSVLIYTTYGVRIQAVRLTIKQQQRLGTAQAAGTGSATTLKERVR